MYPSFKLPISEALEYFGVEVVPLAKLISAVQAGEEAEANAPSVAELEQEILDLEAQVKDLKEEQESLEDQLATANESIERLTAELLELSGE